MTYEVSRRRAGHATVRGEDSQSGEDGSRALEL